jgi:PPOX class probable F420-dependent enzyme
VAVAAIDDRREHREDIVAMAALDQGEIIRRARELGERSGGLVVFDTVATSGWPHPSVVNAGVVDHPVSGESVVALVAVGGSRKIRNLERDPRVTVTFRDGARWLTVRGEAALIGPDHPASGFAADGVPELLRSIYRAAGGGEHPDWAEYDQVMAAERRTAVLVSVAGGYGVYWPVEGRTAVAGV